MKRERVLLYLAAVTIVLVFALVGYGYYVNDQTRALLANRETPPAVERFAHIQEALKESKKQGIPRPEWDSPSSPPAVEADPEIEELLESLKHAEEDFARYYDQLGGGSAWEGLWNDLFERPVSTWSPADWKRLNTFLAEHSELVAEARAMAEATGPVYPLDLSEGYATLLPHLKTMRGFARLLQASAIARAHGADFEGASADILAGLRLGTRLQEEPLIISQLVRVGMDFIMVNGLVEAFPEGQIPPELAVELARHFDSVDFPMLLAQAWQMEEHMGLEYLSGIMEGGWQQGRYEIEQLLPREESPGNTWAALLYASPLARPWQHQDMLAYDRIMNEFEQAFEMPYYEARSVLDQLEQEVDALTYTRLFTRNMLPSMDGFLRLVAREQTREQLLFLGVALEAYANEHGTYPPSLDGIQGQAYDTSIIDPHTGAPFRYHTDGSTFQLYSVGPNLVDDGGDQDHLEGDIVWRGQEQPKQKSTVVAARD